MVVYAVQLIEPHKAAWTESLWAKREVAVLRAGIQQRDDEYGNWIVREMEVKE